MPVSRNMEVSSGNEVAAKVFFELAEHAAQMKVTMVSGNSTASVVAYCCAALNDRLKLNLISSRYLLRVKNPLEDPQGYLYGLCDVLTHPDVADIVEREEDLELTLEPLPANHPNDMYIAPTVPASRSSQRSSAARGSKIRPPTSPTSPFRYEETSRLEQAMDEEVQREISRMPWGMRPSGRPLSTLEKMPPLSADEMASERIMQARENMRKTTIPPPPPPPMSGERQYVSTDTQTVEVSEVPQMQPRPPASAPSVALEMMKKELQASEENLKTTKEKLQQTLERAEVSEAKHQEEQSQVVLYLTQLEVEKEKVKNLMNSQRDYEGVKDELERLKKENMRLKKLHQTAQEREKDLLQEIHQLQTELTSEADVTLQSQPPPLPPQPINITTITTQPSQRRSRTASSGSPVRERYQRITRETEVIRSPGTPEVHIDPSDSLGTIVAKFTGKEALGKAVDTSLRIPAPQMVEEEDSEDEEYGDEPFSQLTELKKKLPLLSSPTADPALRLSLLKEVEALRSMVSSTHHQYQHHQQVPLAPPTPLSGPFTSSLVAPPRGPGPGSPGGPRSRSSTATTAPIHGVHYPPAPSSVASGYSATRPPGL